MSFKELNSLALEKKEYLIALRRRIHENPELDFNCENTARLVEKELDDLDIRHFRVAGTGVVGVLQGGNGGKTVAFRADMDALPVYEATKAVYASKVEGRMHACGHDVHTASLEQHPSAAMREKFSGTVKFFQPAEETNGGLSHDKEK